MRPKVAVLVKIAVRPKVAVSAQFRRVMLHEQGNTLMRLDGIEPCLNT